MKKLLGLCALVLGPGAAFTQTFSDNFDVDSTANWAFNSSVTPGVVDGPADGHNMEMNAYFDYSTVGIPSAPHSTGGSTRGMMVQANVFGTTSGVFSGMSASPIGKTFLGDITLTFDCWQNYQGPMNSGFAGTTQAMFAGINGVENVAQFPGGTMNGVGFATTVDGQSSSDYRAYNGSGTLVAGTSGAYAAGNVSGSLNNSDVYYTSRFQGSVPAAQATLFPGQTGAVPAGAAAMAWRTWEIKRVGQIVTWKIDGHLIATLTQVVPVNAGKDIFLGFFDTNAGVSTQATSKQLLFGLVDNVTVVPEPGSFVVLGAAGAILLATRRRR